jgi:hypothetical protein
MNASSCRKLVPQKKKHPQTHKSKPTLRLQPTSTNKNNNPALLLLQYDPVLKRKKKKKKSWVVVVGLGSSSD